MKRSRLITSVLLVSFMLMGIGYAVWEDTLKINNTVNTASFGAIFENAASTTPGTTDYVTAEGIIDETDNSILDITIENLYPGANAVVNKKITNISSVPIQIDSANLESCTDSTNEIDGHGILTHRIKIYRPGFAIGNGNYIEYTIDDLSSIQSLNESLQSEPIVLLPGDSTNFEYKLSWFKPKIIDDTNDPDLYQKQTLQFTYKLGYTQCTEE